MKYRYAALVVLGLVALAAGIASVLATTSSVEVTSARTEVTYRQVALQVPKGWVVETKQTCLSRTTKLVLYTPSTGVRRDTISLSEVPHNPPASCHKNVRIIEVRVVRKTITIHGLRVAGFVGAGYLGGTVSPFHLRVTATGPEATKLIRTLHRA